MKDCYLCEQWETESSVAFRLFNIGITFDDVKFEWDRLTGERQVDYEIIRVHTFKESPGMSDFLEFDRYIRRVGLPTWVYFGMDGMLYLTQDTKPENEVFLDGDEDTEMLVFRYEFVDK